MQVNRIAVRVLSRVRVDDGENSVNFDLDLKKICVQMDCTKCE